MKADYAPAIAATALFMALMYASVRAEDWTTSDGNIYQNVTVLRSEPDAVTILYRDGGALIPIASLPADLQKRFDYDPAKAKIAADARAKSDAESAKVLKIETAKGAKIQAAKTAKEKAEDAAIAARKAKEEAQYHNHMPSEPDVVEPNNHKGDILAKPK